MTSTLTRLRSLLSAATALPWRLSENQRDLEVHGERTIDYILGPKQYESDGCGGSIDVSERIVQTDGGYYGPQPPDADLIVAAVNALPQLIRIAEAAEALCGDDISAFGEPKTSDYCMRCGESPDSGSHLPHGHEYADPRPLLALRAAIAALETT